MYPGQHVRAFPEKAAHIMASTGEVVTYQQLNDRSNQLAQLLWSEGLRRGDHIAVMMENNARYFEVYWAATRSGLYLTPVSRHLTAEEAGYIIDDCDARALVVSAAVGDVAAQLVDEAPACRIRLMVDGTIDGFDSYEAAIGAHRPEPLAEEPLGDVLFYSSGTTGRPKGIWRPLSNRDVAGHPWGKMYAGLFDMDEDSVYLSTGPLYHAAALGYAGAVQSLGATVVVLDRFDAGEALRAIEAYRVTHSQWVPTMFTRLLRLPDEQRVQHDLSSHRIAIHGAAPCPPHVKDEMIRWWGPILVEYYGGTEQSGMTLIDSADWLEHRGSVGRPVYGRIRICDDDGGEVPVGTDGLIYFERKELPFRYHKDEAKTDGARHAVNANWSTFGDIGHVDGDGFLYLTDRQNFMIISGGVNIYPVESENVLMSHPLVLDVAVIGVPNEEFGEEVKAIVQLNDSEEPSAVLAAELLTYCRDRLAHYKCPRSVDFDDDLPRLPTGKLSKKVLRERYLAPVRT